MTSAIVAMILLTVLFGTINGALFTCVWHANWNKLRTIASDIGLSILVFAFHSTKLAQAWAINGSSYDGIYYIGFVLFIPMSYLAYRIFKSKIQALQIKLDNIENNGNPND